MKRWFVVATILYSVALFPSLFLMGVVTKLQYSSKSANTNAVWLMVSGAQLLPVLLIVCTAGMWIWHRKGARNIALTFSLLPIANILLLLTGYVLLNIS